MEVVRNKAVIPSEVALGVFALRNEVKDAVRRYTRALAVQHSLCPLAARELTRARQTLKVAGRALRGRGLDQDQHVERLISALRLLTTRRMTIESSAGRRRGTAAPYGEATIHRNARITAEAEMKPPMTSESFWERGQGKKVRRDLIIAALLPVAGSLSAKRDELERLTRLGALPPGPTVDKATLWRWFSQTAKEGEWPDGYDPSAVMPELTNVPPTDSVRLAQATLLLHARRLAGLVSAAAIGGILETIQLHGNVKLLRDVPASLLRDLATLRGLSEKIEAACTECLHLAQARQFTLSTEFLQALPPIQPKNAEAAVSAAASDGELYATSEEFGEQANAVPRPDHLAIVPAESAPVRILRARARAMIIKPVIDGHKTPRQAARFWRERIRSALKTSGAEDIDGIPRAVFRRWSTLSRSTVARWVGRARRAIDSSIARGEIVPPLEQILRTDRAAPAKGDPRAKVNPELTKEVRDRYLVPSRPTATTVRRQIARELGIEVSNRTVQRICQQIDDTERANARGGPAASSVILDKRYLRHATKPNGVWTIDNSWIGKELIDPDVVLPDDEDFYFESALEEMSEGKYTHRTRVERLYMTVVMDACTGLHLAVRLWDRPVNTRTTLLALFDAVLRYGLPDVLYSDNGAEFKNREVAAVLNRAEITQRFSRPYYPQARGRIERTFRTIKEQVLPFLPGYRGYGYELPQEELKVLVPFRRLERELQDQVELLINQVPRRGMRVSRRQHYEDQIGARQLRHPGGMPIELALPLLFHSKDVVVDEIGISAHGKTYSAPELEMIPTGSRVTLYADPYRDTGYCVVIDSKGQERSVVTVEAYGPGNPPPPIGAQKSRAAEARRRMQDLASEQRRRAAEMNELTAAKSEGERMAAQLADAIEADWEIITSNGEDGSAPSEAKQPQITSPPETPDAVPSTALVPRTEQPERPTAKAPRRRIRDEEVTFNPLS
jgi:transposase InsO family protein